MSAFLAAASRCDASLVSSHSYDPARAFDAVREDMLQTRTRDDSSHSASARRGGDGDNSGTPSSSAASTSAPQHRDADSKDNEEHAAAPSQSRRRQEAVFERLQSYSRGLDEVKALSDVAAATAKAAVRSKAHELNSFHAVTGLTLPSLQTPLHANLHQDLVDRAASRTTMSAVAPATSSSGGVFVAADQQPTTRGGSSERDGDEARGRSASPPSTTTKHTASMLPTQNTGVPRRTSERTRRLDAVQLMYRQRILEECAAAQRDDPEYSMPPPDAVVPVMRHDGDTGR